LFRGGTQKDWTHGLRVNIQSCTAIIYCIFQRFNLDWKNRTSSYLHKQLDITGTIEFDIP
jgi:hypothetical protein